MSARKPSERQRRTQRAWKRGQRGSIDGELFVIGSICLLLVLAFAGFVWWCVVSSNRWDDACIAKGGTPIYGGRGGSTWCAAPGTVIPVQQ
jgi:hypothetical protein